MIETGRDILEFSVMAIGTVTGGAAETVGDFVGAKLGDWRTKRAQNSSYKKFAEDVENYVAEHDSALKFEYADLKRFIYRKSIRLSGLDDYIGFEFEDQKLYFEFKDKKLVELAVAIVEDLAPQAEIKKKRGPMLKKG